ncbi:MAG: UTP--glucose-1-phosphate uridylyltransferase [Sulfuricurvum sp.]|nr:UTP--glucose-1-phosphate uridylyltransferase [Sulfuricurvum sp.]MDP3023772.1 UTP--glucose-1-phosphate uridylyltransferase [Sulfuricurvum sp.]
MSEIRYNRMYDTHVIIAPERLHRPECEIDLKAIESSDICPFCEGNESMTPPEIFAIRGDETFANEGGWKTRVVPNLYKAVKIETPYQHHYGMFEYWEGFGAHEIVIDTPTHHISMMQWNVSEVGFWLKTLRERSGDLRRDHRIAYLSLFKNEGYLSGSTQTHSHTQIIGLPIIPREDAQRYRREYEHYKATGKAMLELMVHQEEEDGTRIVSKKGDFTAYCPYASAYPFEVMISSQKELGQIDSLSDPSIEDISQLLLSTLKRLERQLGCFHFNLCVLTPPLQEGTIGYDEFGSIDKYSRFAIRIMPRLYRHGGFEVNTGVLINPVVPEIAAKLLRESSDV